MNNGIPAVNTNTQNGMGQVAHAAEQQPLAAPQPNAAGIQQGQGPGLQPLGQRRLDELPDGPLLSIVAFLQDEHSMVRDINRLAKLSNTPALNELITTLPAGNDELSPFHLLNGPTQAINRCASELAALHNPALLPYFEGCGSIFAISSPARCSQLIQAGIGLGDVELEGKAIADLATGMDELSDPDRLTLVNAAVNLSNIDDHARTYLSVKSAAIALAGMLESSDCLDQQQLAIVVQHAINLFPTDADNLDYAAIEGLGKAIRFLPAEVRESLLTRVVEADPSPQRNMSLANLGFAIASVADAAICSPAIEAALNLQEVEPLAIAIAGFAEAGAMASMELALREQYVNVAFNAFNELPRSEIASMLGAATEYLSGDQRELLVHWATAPDLNLPVGTTDEPSRCYGVCGLAAGLAHLTAVQHYTLVNTAVSFINIENKASAIGAMGQGLQHLHPDRREELVNAALSVGDGNSINALKAITGLGAGARHLDSTQRWRLIDAITPEIVPAIVPEIVPATVPAIAAGPAPDLDLLQELLYAKLSALSAIVASVRAASQPP